MSKPNDGDGTLLSAGAVYFLSMVTARASHSSTSSANSDSSSDSKLSSRLIAFRISRHGLVVVNLAPRLDRRMFRAYDEKEEPLESWLRVLNFCNS